MAWIGAVSIRQRIGHAGYAEPRRKSNLHTIVRLPSGVFSPYTPIPTNILFFDRSGPTQNIWYFEQPLPAGRKSYSKTLPIQFGDFQDCLQWWGDRVKGTRAWQVSADVLLATGCNLDLKNPEGLPDLIHVPPAQLTTDILAREGQLSLDLNEIAGSIHHLLDKVAPENLGPSPNTVLTWPKMKLAQCITPVEQAETVRSDKQYPNLGIYSFGRGLFQKQPIDGALTSAKMLYRVKHGQFLYSRLFAFEGAYGAVSDQFDGYYVSGEYPTFDCDPAVIMPEFLAAVFQSPDIWKKVAQGSKGLGHRRQRVKVEQLLDFELPVPPLEWQRAVVALASKLAVVKKQHEQVALAINAVLPAVLDGAFRTHH